MEEEYVLNLDGEKVILTKSDMPELFGKQTERRNLAIGLVILCAVWKARAVKRRDIREQ